MKSGRYAGELRDVRPDCARQMIADGRAARPDSGVEPGIFTSGNPLPGSPATAKKKAKR